MRRVLWLSSWYPNAADPFTGDFIKRQAEALSTVQPLKIVFAGKYPETPRKQTETAKEGIPESSGKYFILPVFICRQFCLQDQIITHLFQKTQRLYTPVKK